MAEQSRRPLVILTDSDRPCVQCNLRPALSDDWLCPTCRNKLELTWERSMKGVSSPYSTDFEPIAPQMGAYLA